MVELQSNRECILKTKVGLPQNSVVPSLFIVIQLRPGESSVAGKQVDPGFSRAPSNGGKDIDLGYNRKAPGAAGNLDPRFNQHQNGQLRPGESAPAGRSIDPGYSR